MKGAVCLDHVYLCISLPPEMSIMTFTQLFLKNMVNYIKKHFWESDEK